MLISNAFAQTAGAADQGFSMGSILFPVAMVVVFYFLLIRPQQQRAKDLKAMTESIKNGDEVVAAGGILGKVTKVGDDYLTVDIGQSATQSVEIKVQRSAVQAVLPNGTIKAI